MRIIKKLLSNLHRYVFLLLISVLLWAWIYTLCSDTTASKKVVVYIDSPAVSDAAMREKLNEEKPEGIKMIKVFPFSYAFFSSEAPSDADIYIMPESDMELYYELLLPIEAQDGEKAFVKDGEVLGIRIFSASANKGAAASFIQYHPADGTEPQDYYLCYNKKSVHIGTENGGCDAAAFEVFERITELP